MSYNVSQQEFLAVEALPGPQRYEYFLNKVVDWEELWSVGDALGWALMADDAGTQLVPIWPARRFAAAYCVGEWSDRSPREIPLVEWFAKWLPGIEGDNRKIAVFPTVTNKGVIVSPGQMDDDLHRALLAYG